MSGTAPRRFWHVAEAVADEGGFLVSLDGKPVRLPSGDVLRVARRGLAEAIAAEWSAAGGGVIGGLYRPDGLGLTRLAGTMQARIAVDRPHAIATLLGMLESEALCYRAGHPAGLVSRQQAEWQPWLDWLAGRFGIGLVVGEGVMPVSQPESARSGMRPVLEALDDASLTVLCVLAPASGSLVLGLAVVGGVLGADEALRLSALDEIVQAEQWGQDASAARRREILLGEFVEAERFLTLARVPPVSRVLVRGAVQGVGYRVWLRNLAEQAGLTGWVRNLSDGRVEGVLCGSQSVRAEVIAAIRNGPVGARVDDVVVSDEASESVLEGFQILSTAGKPEQR